MSRRGFGAASSGGGAVSRSRWWLASMLLWLCACGAGRVPAWQRAWSEVAKGDDSAALAEAERAFARRAEPKALQAAIAAWEKALTLVPTRTLTLQRLARAYFLLADSVHAIEAESDERRREPMIKAYERGLTLAERGLMLASKPFAARVRAGATPGDATQALGKEAAPLLFWFAVNLGKWARAHGAWTAVYHRHCVRKAIVRVMTVDRGHWHGGADRYLGAYYAFLSSVMGGDAERSRRHFETSLLIAPHFLGTKVLMAEFLYGKRLRDRARFVATLKEVLAADPKVIPDLEPEQRLAQRRARVLLKRVDELLF